MPIHLQNYKQQNIDFDFILVKTTNFYLEWMECSNFVINWFIYCSKSIYYLSLSYFNRLGFVVIKYYFIRHLTINYNAD